MGVRNLFLGSKVTSFGETHCDLWSLLQAFNHFYKSAQHSLLLTPRLSGFPPHISDTSSEVDETSLDTKKGTDILSKFLIAGRKWQLYHDLTISDKPWCWCNHIYNENCVVRAKWFPKYTKQPFFWPIRKCYILNLYWTQQMCQSPRNFSVVAISCLCSDIL